MADKEKIISKCRILLDAYHKGKLGNTRMPEDSSPKFSDKEDCLVYFTLPMSLNYQRDSYKLWESALKTFNDPETRKVFDIKTSAILEESELRRLLLKHKVALQPNRHVAIWQKISKTVYENWGLISKLLEAADYDFLKLRDIVQKEFKKGFPYLSGVKIFNYWSFILQGYCGVKFDNSEFIEIAPDTHIRKCSLLLGVDGASGGELSLRWREILRNSGINPIDMHPVFWFWSRNGFRFRLGKS